MEKLGTGARTALGPTSRRFALELPQYDLRTHSLVGDADLATMLRPTDIYCTNLSLVGSKVRGSICAIEEDREADFYIGGTEDFLPDVQTFPVKGFIDIPLVGLFGFDESAGTLFPLDESASTSTGGKTMEATTLAERLVRWLAEDQVITQEAGRASGGNNLILTAAEQRDRDLLVADGLAPASDVEPHEDRDSEVGAGDEVGGEHLTAGRSTVTDTPGADSTPDWRVVGVSFSAGALLVLLIAFVLCSRRRAAGALARASPS